MKALYEVKKKNAKTLDRETALKWADRAIACFKMYAKTGKSEWLRRAEDYKHEALEHAALVMDYGKTVGLVQRKVERS